ncbi:MAG: hypothetical protein NWE98_01670 [Candidatus Bathyarchaeota archaeon]|nr:hypothetical protein [Candidatus Bathyarchaeota archaeon]
MKKPLVALCAVAVICGLLAVSFLLKVPSAPSNEPEPTLLNTAKPSDPAIDQAVKKAITYLQHTDNPVGLLMLNVIYRQFGIAEFNGSLERFDQLLAAKPEPMTRLFRRIADYNNSIVQPEDFNSVTDQLDRLTIPALYADRMPLPSDYIYRLSNAMESGLLYARQSTKNSGCYLLTHALLATIWLQNNHYNLELPEDFLSSLYQANAALISDGSQVNDIQLEAAAFLYEAGQGNLVNPIFVQNILGAQFSDGGWAVSQEAPSNTDWHPSALALLILLHVQNPYTSLPPMIASTPS